MDTAIEVLTQGASKVEKRRQEKVGSEAGGSGVAPAPAPIVGSKTSATAATFTVNNTGDAPDATIGDGLCATAGGVCTLRAAIAEANATSAADVINITATGTISLSTPLPDITQSLTIDGPGLQQLLVRRSRQNVIDSGWTDGVPAPAAQFRIFSVPSSGLEVVIKDMAIGFGNSVGRGYGGNIFSRSKITLQDLDIRYGMAGVAIVNPIGRAGGGGVAVENADATIERCVFEMNMSRVTTATQQYKEAFGGAILFLSNNGGTRVLNVVNTITINNGTNSADSLTGGEGIQLVTGAGSESIANITNVTFWDYAYSRQMGSHTSGAGAKAAYNVRNTLFLSSHNGTFYGSTENGATAADNKFVSLGTNMSWEYAAGNEVLNGPGDLPQAERLISYTRYSPVWADPVAGEGPVIVWLLPGSPAIDAGPSTGAPTDDFRGLPRDGTYGAIDIGAVESKRFTMVKTDGDNQIASPSSQYAKQLKVTVTANDPAEPVWGGKITFTPPASGPSATIPAYGGDRPTIDATGLATSGYLQANSILGEFFVPATASGVTTPLSFRLGNDNPLAVNSVVRAGSTPSAATSLDFTITFNKSVTGLTASNFVVTGTNFGNAAITGVTGSGAVWTVSINPGTATGTVGLRFANGTGIVDSFGNGLGFVPTNLNPTYTIATRLVSILPKNGSNVTGNDEYVDFAVAFSNSVPTPSASMFQIVGTDIGTARITSVGPRGVSAPNVYDVRVMIGGVESDSSGRWGRNGATGEIGLRMVTPINDTNGNAVANIPFTGTSLVKVSPTVWSITQVDSTPTTTTTVRFLVSFREKVSGLNASHIRILGEGATVSTTDPYYFRSGVTTTVTEKGAYNEATQTWSQNWSHGQLWQYEVALTYDPAIVRALQISVYSPTDTDIAGTADLDGLLIPNPGVNAVNPYSGIYRFNPRVISITRVDANPTAASTVNFKVTFNYSVTGVTSSNFGLISSAAGDMTAVPPIFGSTIMAPKAGGKEAHNGGSGTEWIVPVMVGQNGPIGIDMVNSTGVKDSYNLLVAPLPFTTGETYTIAPKVVSLNRAGASPTNAATVRWVVTFNQAVTGLTAANFALTSSGATLGSVTALPNQSGVVDNKSWQIEASTGSSTGLIGLNMDNSTGVTTADGAAVSGLPFTGQTFSIAPKVVSIT
ncbi:MAG: choice-of-anchor Q domain-containing protein, partial [Acidobacteriota bacterium]